MTDGIKPRTVEELLSPQGYLKELLQFVQDHLQKGGDAKVQTDDLKAAFFQPFAELQDRKARAANEAVGRLRVPVEVLRSYSREKTPAPLLLGHWRCDDADGTTLTDDGPDKNNGTLDGNAAFGPGRLGRAIMFDGGMSGAFVKIPHDPRLKLGDVNGEFSVAFWLLVQEGFTGIHRSIVYKGANFNERTPCLFMRPENNRLDFGISTAANPDEFANSTSELTLDTWNHIAYVKAGRNVLLYVNGQLDGYLTLSADSVGNEGPIFLGRAPVAPDRFPGIKGGIDDLRIYAFALPESAVRRLAEGRAGDARLGGAAEEVSYLRTAYDALLTQLGTSYAELRTTRKATDKERKALAQRLGVPLVAADGKSPLAELVALKEGPTEGWLEQVFGFSDTNQPDPFRQRAEPLVLQWQGEALRQRWTEEDHGEGGASDASPIVDPDLIGEDDLLPSQPTDPVRALLAERRTWVEQQEKEIKEQLGANPAKEAFAAAVSAVLGPDVDLVALSDASKNGQPIAQELEDAHLNSVAFRRLLYARELAEQGELVDPTRQDAAQIVDDTVQILTEVRKEQQFASWKTAEKDAGVTLSPDHFKLSEQEEAPWPWRSSRPALVAWQRKLQDRYLDRERLGTNLSASIIAAEERALPLLRDALVARLADEQLLPQVTDRLSRLLFVDLNHSGLGQTTRVMEAVETVQGIVNAIRGGGIGSDHLAAGWSLAPNHPGGQEGFDLEWTTVGSHPAWQGAWSAFLYPENALLPTLRPNWSNEFDILVKDVRKMSRLTPSQADDHYKPGDLEQEERDFAAPVFLALELQKAGYHLAALTWLRKVYDHRLPPGQPDQRKKWEHLRQEVNGAPILFPNLDDQNHWALTFRNPHEIAAKRLVEVVGGETKPWNAYTRFTLITIVRCLLDFADSEFAADTSESVAHARSLYLEAQDLLSLPDLDTIPPTGSRQVLLPNAVVEGLRTHTVAQLAKIRSGRNAAGLRRQLELLPVFTREGAAAVASGPPAPVQVLPTPYRYATLVERSKQLVAIAQQAEANYLAALEKRDIAEEKLITQDIAIEVGETTVALQRRRGQQAETSTKLAIEQRRRSEIAKATYDSWIADGPNEYETHQVERLRTAQTYRTISAGLEAASATLSFAQSSVGSDLVKAIFGGGAATIYGGLQIGIATLRGLSGDADTEAQVAGIRASQERRTDEWRFQSALAEQDSKIGDQQVQVARDEEEIRSQELRVAEIQKQGAEQMQNFLLGKFTSAEMYAWLAGVLGGIYAYFLQQAASTAQLAQSQLSFERQETPPSYIQSDYWRSPPEAAKPSGENGGGKDRRGLTGSARLLEDLYRLDQHAFETDKRRLNLAQTFSMARLVPFEFERFKETGTLPFATPVALFDQGFPGHYLRLVKRVRTTLVALIPPNQGIRATLLASGISRVVVGPEVFRLLTLRRDPEQVALTSPAASTGVFELDAQPELLLPFEGMGVDTQWEFVLPKAANGFDYRTIADLLVTIEYTALHSYDYQQQVVRTLERAITADRIWSVRDNLADEWYDLNNPDQAQHPWEVHLETKSADFPANLMDPVRIGEVLAYVVAKEGTTPAEGELALGYAYKDGADVNIDALPARLQAGVVSTRRTDGNNAWGTHLRAKPAVGRWNLQIRDTGDLRRRFQVGEIEDVIIILSFAGQRPPWPA